MVLSAARLYRVPDACAVSATDATTIRTPLMNVRIMTSLLTLSHRRIGSGLIGAERFLGEERSGGGIGARAAAAADRLVAAFAALAVVGARVAQLREHARAVPDVGKPLDARVARADRQVAARIDFAFVRHEADAGAGEAAARH